MKNNVAVARLIKRTLFVFGVALSVYGVPKEEPNAVQIAELQKKIAEYKEKTTKVQEKIGASRSESVQEQQSHDRYRETFAIELSRLEKEKSELTSEKIKIGRSADSLGVQITSFQGVTREMELRQQQFSKSVLEAIEIYNLELSRFPAPLLSKERESLLFLKNELSNGSISAIEGIERLWTVIQTINRERLTVDVWQALSTWEQVTGQVHYMRIGYGWLGMVNENSSKGAVWNGDSWVPVTNPSQLSSMRTAVKIRGGNAVPLILSLPVTATEKAGKQ